MIKGYSVLSFLKCNSCERLPNVQMEIVVALHSEYIRQYINLRNICNTKHGMEVRERNCIGVVGNTLISTPIKIINIAVFL